MFKIMKPYILEGNTFFFLSSYTGEDLSKSDMFRELLWLLPVYLSSGELSLHGVLTGTPLAQ